MECQATTLNASINLFRILIPAAFFLIAAGYIHAFVRNRESHYRWIKPLLGIGIGLQLLLFSLLFLDGGVFPFTTVTKGLFFCTIALSFLFVLMRRVIDDISYGAFLFPVHFIVSTTAMIFLNQGVPLPRVMSSYYFIIHVTMLFTAYACFLTSFVVSILYLLQYSEIKMRRPGSLLGRLPPLEMMDHSVKVFDTLGLSLVFLGIISGLLWLDTGAGVSANVSKKAGLVMLTAIIYLSEHFLRTGKGWKGRRACLVSIAGFALVVCTLLAGRHGY